MTATDWILTAVLLVILGAAVTYIVKAKKSGAKCIGCPASKTCGSHKSGKETECCCGCGGEKK